jgi:uncharacterized protein YdiU (UPF0061 family)
MFTNRIYGYILTGNEGLKRTLLDHVLTYYPEIDKNDSSVEQYAALYTEVVRRTAELVAR